MRTRGEAEALVKSSTLDWTIYQPSTIFGHGDGLVSRFDALLRMALVMPLPRPNAKMAPVFLGDVAEAIAVPSPESLGLAAAAFELYGRETWTLLDLVRAIRDARGLPSPRAAHAGCARSSPGRTRTVRTGQAVHTG